MYQILYIWNVFSPYRDEVL